MEDLDLLRTALVSLLSDEDDLAVVAALRCGDEQVVPTATRLRPDVIVVDVGASGERGLAMIEELLANSAGSRIVALVPAQPAGMVRRLLLTDVLGAVEISAPAARLLEAIRGAARGEPVIDVNLAVTALAVGTNPLTPREKDVLRLVADGASGSEIASRLHLSPGTVRNYLSRAIDKTRARTRFEAVRIASEADWI
ncbi:MAG TPA: response regulator transcription factor [Actinophytocola sp.]|uniref:response regulator transcription factor n=1 Tax=Actinophytocola sp. TaxID=1872138 RepID=UPI002DDD0B3E|nr:response regulator transcription factor [Actinophytocola sp.]HEV2783907.1 response regulator transcription factor [Actinophytocola sp.]